MIAKNNNTINSVLIISNKQEEDQDSQTFHRDSEDSQISGIYSINSLVVVADEDNPEEEFTKEMIYSLT